MNANEIDFSDVQGLVRFAHGHLTEACFLLVQVVDANAARSWLDRTAVTSAISSDDLPDTALQVAFSCPGLQALGVPVAVIETFSPEFIEGMSGDENRTRRLGDVANSAPNQWLWGKANDPPHLLLMMYARPGKLDAWKQSIMQNLSNSGLSVQHELCTAALDGYEHFGFRDGISQPELDWDMTRESTDDLQLEYSNRVALGEFLLGYPNEYGQYMASPMVDAKHDLNGILLTAKEQPDKHDLGRNGTYLVFRHLQQDVPKFWQFLNDQAKGDPIIRKAIAEAMIGRTQEGTPLIADPPISGPETSDDQLNQFTFTSDQDGIHCPFGAHIRRANPRNADLPAGSTGLLGRLLHILGFCRASIRSDTIASTRFHRILRRGRKYGSPLTTEEALQLQADNTEPRGMYFISINANIGRQFEFVQNAWIMNPKFNALAEAGDPLLGNRIHSTGASFVDTFSHIEKDGRRRRIVGMPQFVTVRGGAYFFLPSIRALRYFASLNG